MGRCWNPPWRAWPAPEFSSRLIRRNAIAPPRTFKPNYELRLRIVDNLRQAVTDETLGAILDQVQSNLTQRVVLAESQTP